MILRSVLCNSTVFCILALVTKQIGYGYSKRMVFNRGEIRNEY